MTTGTPYLLPGFIDLHVHGGGGFDICRVAKLPVYWHKPAPAMAQLHCLPRQ